MILKLFLKAIYFIVCVYFQYYTQVLEEEAWVQEKLPFVSNEDYGRDETSAQTLLRKHETIELDFERFGKRIDELESLCRNLEEAGNYDSENIKQRQVVLTVSVSFPVAVSYSAIKYNFKQQRADVMTGMTIKWLSL
jgi:hypothetical protein